MDMAEMIKELIENQDDIYCVVSAEHLQASMHNGFVNFTNVDKGEEFILHTSYNWRKLRKPATWQEAIEAWINDNKSFKIVMPDGGELYQSNEKRLGLFGVKRDGFFIDHFSKGKWYIED